MIVCIPVDDVGWVGPAWGRAAQVAVADVQNGEIVSWDVHEVRWDIRHDEGTHGGHHARVVTFLREHGIEAVAVRAMGEGMTKVLHAMDIPVWFDADGPARDVALAIAAGESR